MADIVTWNTHKTDAGFAWKVIQIGYQVPTITLKSGVAPTRAIAVRIAKQWTRHIKHRAATAVA